MNKVSTIKKISLSTVLISALAGCGGGGGATSSSTSSQPSVVTSRSQGLTYDSCVDLNLNLQCEESEKNLNPADYPNIAVTSKENDGKYLLGPWGTSKVSASSTLVYNEMKYNPLVNNNQSQAISYISTKLNNSSSRSISASSSSMDSLLTEEQSKDLEDSIKSAIAANPKVNKNTVVAAVCEKFLESKTKVSVNSSDIQKQTRVLSKVTVSQYNKIDWNTETIADLVGAINDSTDANLVKTQGGERIVSLHGNGGYQVAASQYHNALTVINYNQSKQHQYEKFAAFRVNYNTGKGGTLVAPLRSSGGSVGGDSSGGGSVGGGVSSGGSGVAQASSASYSSRSLNFASISKSITNQASNYTVNTDPNNTKNLWEHLLEDAKITKDGNYVYALVRSKDESVKYPDESTYGFFRTKVGAHGVYPYNSNTTLRISSKDIKKFELSNSDNRVIVYGQVTNDKGEKQNILRVLNQDLTLIKAIEIDNVNDFTITANDRHIVASIKGSYLTKPKLVKYDSATLGNKKEVELPFDIDEVFTYAHGTMALVANKATNKIALVNLESMTLEQEKALNLNANLFSMSTDGKYFAAASKDKVNIYNLSTPELTFQTTIEAVKENPTAKPLSSPFYTEGVKEKSENAITNLSFVSENLLTLSLKNMQNMAITYKIDDSNAPMTVSNKLDTALATLDKDSINKGYDLNKVKSDLTLASSYKDVTFSWRVTGLQSNINTTTGKVTRGNSNVSGNLIVTASTTFRNETTTKEKTFDVTVLKDSPKVTESIQKFNQLHTVKTPGLMSKVISNSDGSTIISYSKLDDTYRGYNLFKLENNQLKFTDGNENSTKRLLRDELLNMTFESDDRIIVATVNNNNPSTSTLYVQDVLSDNTLEEGYNSKVLNKAYTGNQGTPRSAGFSGDKSKVVIIRKHHDFNYADYYADIYKISGTKVTKEKSVRMKPALEYINTHAPAVNNDASVFYQIAKNAIYKHVDANTISSVRLDNVDAVYYFDNRVYATTKEGIIVSYDENLSEASKQEFNLGNEGKIANLEFTNSMIYAFAENKNSGVYVVRIDSSKAMSGYKFSAKTNTRGGTVSKDGEHVFTFENVPTSYQFTINSNISYSKTN